MEPPLHPTELDLIQSARSSRAKRALVVLAGFLIAVGVGVAATLAWQSYGDAARRTIAKLHPQLARLAPPAAPAEPTASAGASPDQLVAILRSLAGVRQSVDKLAADIAKLQATKQDTLSPDLRVSRTAAPPPAAVGPAVRKPVPPSQAPPPVR